MGGRCAYSLPFLPGRLSGRQIGDTPQTMSDLVKIRARPKLNCPNMVAAWPGIADVASIAVSYLKKRLEFKDLGEVDAAHFFNPIGITARDNVVEEPQFPQSRFYYWKNQPGKSDLILFIGDDQPAVKT